MLTPVVLAALLSLATLPIPAPDAFDGECSSGHVPDAVQCIHCIINGDPDCTGLPLPLPEVIS